MFKHEHASRGERDWSIHTCYYRGVRRQKSLKLQQDTQGTTELRMDSEDSCQPNNIN